MSIKDHTQQLEELDRFKRLQAETTDPLAARLLQEIITELEAALDRDGDMER